MPSSKTGPRSRRNQLAALGVGISGQALRDYRAWAKRAAAVGEPLHDLVGFGGWFEAARDAWVGQAESAGLWARSTRDGGVRSGDCHSDDPDRMLGHVVDTDGTIFHLYAEEASRAVTLRGRYCRTTIADRSLERVWQEDQRLTFEELLAGEPCRGCGRQFFGGPEFVAQKDRTPEQQAALDAEDAAYFERHPNCAAMAWSVEGGGVYHCGRCCPPPPLSPELEHEVASLLGQILLEREKREHRLASKWGARRSAG